jgi:PAS domain-containing protein
VIPAAVLDFLWDAVKGVAVVWVVVQNPWARGVIVKAWRRMGRWLPQSRLNRRLGELRGGIEHIWDSLAVYLLRLEAVELGSELPVVTCAADGGLLWASPPYLQLVGAPLTSVVQHGWAGFIHPDDQERVFRLWTQAREGRGNDLVLEFRLVHNQGGRTIWVHSIIKPARNPKTHRVAGWVATLSPLGRPPEWFMDSQPRKAAGDGHCPAGYFEPPMGY